MILWTSLSLVLLCTYLILIIYKYKADNRTHFDYNVIGSMCLFIDFIMSNLLILVVSQLISIN